MTSSSKVDPHILKEAVKKVKTMSKEYANGDLQSDVWYYQTHRPRLLRNAEIAEDAEDGRITYNVQRVAGMTADDQRAIHRYNPSLTVDEPMSARIPRDNGISGTFLIVLKTLYAGATSKVF